MAGIACKLDDIIKLSKKLKLTLIEDCAHGSNTMYQNKHVGNFGITGCFLLSTKQITTGEGGAIVTNDIKIYKIKS